MALDIYALRLAERAISSQSETDPDRACYAREPVGEIPCTDCDIESALSSIRMCQLQLQQNLAVISVGDIAKTDSSGTILTYCLLSVAYQPWPCMEKARNPLTSQRHSSILFIHAKALLLK